MDEARWDMFFQLGMQAYQAGDFDQACQAFEVAVEEARLEQPAGLTLARSLNNLACALSHRGQLGASIALQEEALALSRQVLGEEHEVVAGGLLNLASDYAKCGRLAEAEALFQNALSRPCSPGIRVQALENLGQFYMAQEKLPEAAEIFQQLLSAQRDQPQNQAKTLHALTHIYDALGDLPRADASRSQTLQLIEDLWGAHTLAYAEVVANLAESLMQQQRLLHAAQMYGRAAQSFEQCVPEDDARLLGCRLGRLVALRESGQLDEAAQLGASLGDRIIDHRVSLGEISRRWLNEYALVLFLQQRYQEAAHLFERSLELPEELPMAARISIQFNLASAWMGAGDELAARKLLEKISGLAEEHLGGEHGMTLRIWAQLKELYRRSGQSSEEAAIDEKLTRYIRSPSV